MSFFAPNRAARAATIHANAPWGGKSDSDTEIEGDADGKSEPKNPWDLPPVGPKRIEGKDGPSLFDRVGDLTRSGFGGNFGGPLPQPRRGTLSLFALSALTFWVATSSVHMLGQNERGVVTRLGGYARTLGPGLALTLPAPFEQLQAIDTGTSHHVDVPDGVAPLVLLTHDGYLVQMRYSVAWSVSDPAKYLYGLDQPLDGDKGNPRITSVAQSAVRAAMADRGYNAIVYGPASAIESDVRARIQKALDSYGAGVRIDGVTLNDVRAPDAISDALQAVNTAKTDAEKAKAKAKTDGDVLIARAESEGREFDGAYAEYHAAPDVMRRRLYYQTMEEILAHSEKVIVSPGVSVTLPASGKAAAPASTPTPAAPRGGGGQ